MFSFRKCISLLKLRPLQMQMDEQTNSAEQLDIIRVWMQCTRLDMKSDYATRALALWHVQLQQVPVTLKLWPLQMRSASCSSTSDQSGPELLASVPL